MTFLVLLSSAAMVAGQSAQGDTCTYTIYGQNGLGGPALSMRAAVDACIDNGGQLASAHSQVDADVFADLVDSTAWIGYHGLGFAAGCPHSFTP